MKSIWKVKEIKTENINKYVHEKYFVFKHVEVWMKIHNIDSITKDKHKNYFTCYDMNIHSN